MTCASAGVWPIDHGLLLGHGEQATGLGDEELGLLLSLLAIAVGVVADPRRILLRAVEELTRRPVGLGHVRHLCVGATTDHLPSHPRPLSMMVTVRCLGAADR